MVIWYIVRKDTEYRMRYENTNCPACGRLFEENDDIVVCPECGTPHHRGCYELLGHCANENLHVENYAFENIQQNPQPEENTEINDPNQPLICPVCRHENPANSESCEFCGQKFTLFGFNVLQKQTQLENEEKEEQKNNGESGYAQFEHAGTANDIDGVSVDDLSEYVRNNYKKYLTKFEKISNKKPTWNWASFLFSPYWFFYRKLIKPGIIFLTAFLCLSIIFSGPMNKIADSYFAAGEILEDESVSQQEKELAVKETYDTVMDQLPFIGIYLGIVLLLKIVAALISDRLYKKRVTKNIETLRQTPMSDNDFHLMMFKVGGVAPILVVFSYTAEYLLSMLAGMIMS